MKLLLFRLGRHVGSGGVAPNEKTLENLISFIGYLQLLPAIRIPFVSTDDDGYVVFEWHRADRKYRKLSITITNVFESATYLKSWGANMVTEMEDGRLYDVELLDLFLWLNEVDAP